MEDLQRTAETKPGGPEENQGAGQAGLDPYANVLSCFWTQRVKVPAGICQARTIVGATHWRGSPRQSPRISPRGPTQAPSSRRWRRSGGPMVRDLLWDRDHGNWGRNRFQGTRNHGSWSRHNSTGSGAGNTAGRQASCANTARKGSSRHVVCEVAEIETAPRKTPSMSSHLSFRFFFPLPAGVPAAHMARE